MTAELHSRASFSVSPIQTLALEIVCAVLNVRAKLVVYVSLYF
jgi:hypothetical protein